MIISNIPAAFQCAANISQVFLSLYFLLEQHWVQTDLNLNNVDINNNFDHVPLGATHKSSLSAWSSQFDLHSKHHNAWFHRQILNSISSEAVSLGEAEDVIRRSVKTTVALMSRDRSHLLWTVRCQGRSLLFVKMHKFHIVRLTQGDIHALRQTGQHKLP